MNKEKLVVSCNLYNFKMPYKNYKNLEINGTEKKEIFINIIFLNIIKFDLNHFWGI